MGETCLINKCKPHHIQPSAKTNKVASATLSSAFLKTRSALGSVLLSRMRLRQFCNPCERRWRQQGKELPQARVYWIPLSNPPPPLFFSFFFWFPNNFFPLLEKKKRASKCYKDTLYKKTSVHLAGARLRRAGSNLGGSRQECSSPIWAQREILTAKALFFLFGREKSIFQSPSHGQAFLVGFFFFFFFPCGFQLCETGSEWPLEKLVNA